MWIFVLGLSGAVLISCIWPGRNVLKISKALYETVSDKISHRTKNIELINVNNKPVILYEDIALPAFKQKHTYDVNCFYTEDEHFLKGSLHNQNYTNENYTEIDMNIIKYGVYSSMIPFRPSDFGYTHLLVSVKKINEDIYSVYKFDSSDYINLYDIYEKYDKDTKESKEEINLAEAFD